jgi:hypothetical protein
MEKIIVPLQIGLASFLAICVWFRFFLPYSYFSIASVMALLIIVSIHRGMRRRFVVLQILLAFLLINNIYGLANHFSVLPYGDSYWDYSVVRTFLQNGRIYTIPLQASTEMLTWYSGWPVIHALASVLSTATGMTPFYVVQLIPVLVSLCVFFVVYLFLEKVSGKLALSSDVVYLGLLIFALSPDMIFWETQFVRMNLGLLWLGFIFYSTYLLISQPYRKRGIVFVLILAATILVATHHFISFVAATFLLTLIILQFLGRRFGEGKIGSKVFQSNLYVPTVSLAVLMFVCTFLWWESFGKIIWSTVELGVTRLIDVLTGAQGITFYAPQPIYPAQLTPQWAVNLLRVRDSIMLLPTLLGIPIVLIKKPRTAARFFVVYGALFFGAAFLVNDVSFKIEPFRFVTLAMPFVALSTATAYGEIKIRANRLWKIVLPTIILLLILTSFMGLWGHSFAPMHLYNPEIKASEVGEHLDVSRLNVFFKEKIPVDNFGLIWGDDFGSLILLLDTSQISKIQKLTPDNLPKMGLTRSELFVEVSDLYLYKYYAGIYNYVKDPEEAKAFAQVIGGQLRRNFGQIYDDGTCRLWKK